MKFMALIACVVFSGSMAFAHCGSCGTGEAKSEKHSCDKSKKKKGHKCDGKCDKAHKRHKKNDGHKAHHHSH